MLILLSLAFQMATAPVPACPGVAPPPAGLIAWSGRDAIAPAVGTPATVPLRPMATATFVTAPSRPAAPGTYGQSFALSVTKPGTYRIALSAGAWIDVIDGGSKSIASIAHAEGPGCSGIRKIVDFSLTPGAYAIELSGAKTTRIRMLVVAK